MSNWAAVSICDRQVPNIIPNLQWLLEFIVLSRELQGAAVAEVAIKQSYIMVMMKDFSETDSDTENIFTNLLR